MTATPEPAQRADAATAESAGPDPAGAVGTAGDDETVDSATDGTRDRSGH